jgi:hypothetical protein
VSDITEVGLETWKDSRENGVEEWDELDQDISVASPIFPESFFTFAAGSVVYWFSALSMIYGIARMLGPFLVRAHVLQEALPCIYALNFYEVALLGTLVLISAWKNVLDDAISLVALIALFLAGSGMALSTVADSGSSTAFGIGLFCTGIGIAKLSVMRRFVSLYVRRLSLIGVSLVLAWNFLNTAGFSKWYVDAATADAVKRNVWLGGWLVVLAGGMLIVLDAMRKPGEQDRQKVDDKPFVRSPAMMWVFALILLTVTTLHQYEVAYIYDLAYAFGDFLPIISVLALLLLGLIRNLRDKPGATEVVVACFPLAATVYSVITRTTVARATMGVELLWYPPVLLGATGAAILWVGLRNRWWWCWYVALAYIFGLILSSGFSPGEPCSLNWCLFGSFLGASLLLLGVVRKNPFLCLLAVVISAIGLATTEALGQFARAYCVAEAAGVTGFIGLGILVSSILLGRSMPRAVCRTGAVFFMLFTFDYLSAGGIAQGASGVAVIGVISLLTWIRVKDAVSIGVLWVPLACKAWWFVNSMREWRYVILGFGLLVVGAWLSIRKGKARQESTITQEDVMRRVST